MSLQLEQDLAELLKNPPTGPDGKPRTFATRETIVARGALARVPEVLARYAPNREVFVIADNPTMAAAGDQVEAMLDEGGFSFGVAVLEDEDGESPEADMSVVEGVLDALDDSLDLVVAVGSGTINDLCKMAAFKLGKPYVVIPTAPSMNGYTSAIAALTEDDLKKTIPCRGPIAVVADTDVLARAPRKMIQAGLGDFMSKPVSGSDWKLASLIMGEPHWDFPGKIVKSAFAQVTQTPELLAKRDLAAVETLTQALLLSGFSMAVAGSSSPASGGEHLISHYWDMMAPHDGREKELHGLQVAIGTLLTATLYQSLQNLEPRDIDIDALAADREQTLESYLEDLKKRQPELFDAIKDEAAKKFMLPDAYALHLRKLLGNWDTIWETLGPQLMAPEMIRDIFTKAGVPTSADALGLSRSDVFRALTSAHEIRNRYTVLDLASDVGVLERTAEELIDAAGLFV